MEKQILQELCKDGVDWDDPISEQIRARWEKWRRELFLLNDVTVRRSFKPDGFQQLKSVELHHFSEGSVSGYGQCSYVRLVDENDEVHCSLAMGKSRVTPLKNVTIPRLELTAALVSVKVSTMLSQELDYDKVIHIYWTDSRVVPVSSIYIWSKNFSHSAYVKSEAKDGGPKSMKILNSFHSIFLPNVTFF